MSGDIRCQIYREKKKVGIDNSTIFLRTILNYLRYQNPGKICSYRNRTLVPFFKFITHGVDIQQNIDSFLSFQFLKHNPRKKTVKIIFSYTNVDEPLPQGEW